METRVLALARWSAGSRPSSSRRSAARRTVATGSARYASAARSSCTCSSRRCSCATRSRAPAPCATTTTRLWGPYGRFSTIGDATRRRSPLTMPTRSFSISSRPPLCSTRPLFCRPTTTTTTTTITTWAQMPPQPPQAQMTPSHTISSSRSISATSNSIRTRRRATRTPTTSPWSPTRRAAFINTPTKSGRPTSTGWRGARKSSGITLNR